MQNSCDTYACGMSQSLTGTRHNGLRIAASTDGKGILKWHEGFILSSEESMYVMLLPHEIGQHHAQLLSRVIVSQGKISQWKYSPQKTHWNVLVSFPGWSVPPSNLQWIVPLINAGGRIY